MKKVTLYTTEYCPYCDAASRMLDLLEVEYDKIDLTSDSELREKLSEANDGFKTVPMIFIGDKFIGGYTELRILHNAGELKELLEDDIEETDDPSSGPE